MFIHNFYADVMISVRTLFDNYIFSFGNNYIKRYEFSIGSRPFQLAKDYNPNYEFPMVIVSLGEDVHPYSVRTNTVKFMASPDNIHQTLVLYNKTTMTAVYVQEEMTVVPMDLIINCESILQAKEIEHQIKRFLPQDKYIQFLNYISFLELSPDLLTRCGFDVRTHEVDNLYSRFNKNLDQIEYCFGINYKPLIKLDAISLSATDSSQRSFPLAVSISYLLQMPEYIICIDEGIIEKIDIHYYKFGFEPIIGYPLQKVRQQDYIEDDNRYVVRNLVFFDENDKQIYYTADKAFFTVEFNKSEFELTEDMTYSFITSNCEKFKNQFESLLNVADNKVTFIFSLSDWQSNFNISLTSPAILQIWKPKTS